MFGNPHFNPNAHRYACARARIDMQALADDKSLSEQAKLLARQACDLIDALKRELESING